MRIYKRKGILEQKIDDELIMYVSVNDSIVNIDAVGAKLWEMIDNGIELEDLVVRFYNCFDEKPCYEHFFNEIDDVLSSYVKAGLLEFAEET